MANVKISDLGAATQVKDSDQVEINQGGSSFSATKQQVAGYVTQYDISAGNQTETLPDAATYPGLTYTAIVTGGDGTFDFQWVATDDIIRDGNVETPAHEAVQGEGVTTVIAKGGDWVTLEYEDSVPDLGDGAFIKYLASVDIYVQDTKDNASTASQTFNQPITLTAVLGASIEGNNIGARMFQFDGDITGFLTTFTVLVRLISTAALDAGAQDFVATVNGKW